MAASSQQPWTTSEPIFAPVTNFENLSTPFPASLQREPSFEIANCTYTRASEESRIGLDSHVAEPVAQLVLGDMRKRAPDL